jgi:hypothetical protein
VVHLVVKRLGAWHDQLLKTAPMSYPTRPSYFPLIRLDEIPLKSLKILILIDFIYLIVFEDLRMECLS